ncbi:Heat shock 70 kDa protein 6 [Smittium mucronatum]|uniref:Heat shock 70 kDa protein 6 n=1 Tax=Smittium mucronatum TaxID=133383 RepID=A0A1R0H5Y0_9FUNG|nr:Heat shock 70 kDa protein 6 [Smittium mucronatum]
MEIIGIDLGTTFSCVGIFKNNRVEIIANSQGNRTTPSCVAFTEEGRLIGEAAINQASGNPENTVSISKRYIGRRMNKSELKDKSVFHPCNLVLKGDKPFFKIICKGEKKLYSPEQISSMILVNLKKSAEDYLGKKVKNAIITVPAYFNDSQRQATKDAGEIAGLNVVRLLNEPTSAAVAYGLLNSDVDNETVLVYDFGGGTFDVTILRISNKQFTVLATGGDTKLGGEDIDTNLVRHLVEFIKNKHGVDVSINSKSMKKLRIECEKAKRMLSFSLSTTIEIPSILNGIDLKYPINVPKFVDINIEIFESTIDKIKDILECSKMKPEDINRVVLVGGSTRIPYVQKIVSEYFGDKELEKTINPDEAVALGAAIKANSISETPDNNIILYDVVPLSIGVRVKGDIISVMINRNTRIPFKATKMYTTESDNQTEVTVDVYEGVRKDIKNNHLLGKFELCNIEKAPANIPKIEITFEVDIEGILKVTATDISSGNKNFLVCNNDMNRLTNEEITSMIKEGKEFEEEEMISAKKELAREMLEIYIYKIKRKIIKDSKNVDVDLDKLKELKNITNEAIFWIENSDSLTKEDYDLKRNELIKECKFLEK